MGLQMDELIDMQSRLAGKVVEVYSCIRMSFSEGKKAEQIEVENATVEGDIAFVSHGSGSCSKLVISEKPALRESVQLDVCVRLNKFLLASRRRLSLINTVLFSLSSSFSTEETKQRPANGRGLYLAFSSSSSSKRVESVELDCSEVSTCRPPTNILILIYKYTYMLSYMRM